MRLRLIVGLPLRTGPHTPIHPAHIIQLKPTFHLLLHTHIPAALLPSHHHAATLSRQHQLPSFSHSQISNAFSQLLGVEHGAGEISDDDAIAGGQQDNQPRVTTCQTNSLSTV